MDRGDGDAGEANTRPNGADEGGGIVGEGEHHAPDRIVDGFAEVRLEGKGFASGKEELKRAGPIVQRCDVDGGEAGVVEVNGAVDFPIGGHGEGERVVMQVEEFEAGAGDGRREQGGIEAAVGDLLFALGIGHADEINFEIEWAGAERFEEIGQECEGGQGGIAEAEAACGTRFDGTTVRDDGEELVEPVHHTGQDLFAEPSDGEGRASAQEDGATEFALDGADIAADLGGGETHLIGGGLDGAGLVDENDRAELGEGEIVSPGHIVCNA